MSRGVQAGGLGQEIPPLRPSASIPLPRSPPPSEPLHPGGSQGNCKEQARAHTELAGTYVWSHGPDPKDAWQYDPTACCRAGGTSTHSPQKPPARPTPLKTGILPHPGSCDLEHLIISFIST